MKGWRHLRSLKSSDSKQTTKESLESPKNVEPSSPKTVSQTGIEQISSENRNPDNLKTRKSEAQTHLETDPILKEFPLDSLKGRKFVVPEECKELDWNPKGTTYKGALANGKPHGIGLMKCSGGSTYLGDFVHGRAEGFGVLKWKDGSKVEGAFKNGKQNGYCTYTFQDGSKFFGNFVNDKREGRGREVHVNGIEYIGDHRNDMRWGKGILKSSNMIIYDGDYIANEKDGFGVSTMSNGNVYAGEWKRSKPEGKGMVIWPDGGVYEGDLKDGQINGNGIVTLPDGRVYEGEFKMSKPDGKGKYTWPDGVVYEGGYKDGKKNGYGVLTSPDGRKFESVFKDGKCVDADAAVESVSIQGPDKPPSSLASTRHCAAGGVPPAHNILNPSVPSLQEYPEQTEGYGARLFDDSVCLTGDFYSLWTSGLERDPTKSIIPIEDSRIAPSSSSTSPSSTKRTDSNDPSCCVICLCEPPQMVFVPCGHLKTCESCSTGLKECPYCRQPISQTMRVYA